MTPWTINNETRIIEAHKPIAKLSSRCRTRVEIAHRVALVPRATNRARFCVNMGERLADNRLKELLISDFAQSGPALCNISFSLFLKLPREQEVITLEITYVHYTKTLQTSSNYFKNLYPDISECDQISKFAKYLFSDNLF